MDSKVDDETESEHAQDSLGEKKIATKERSRRGMLWSREALDALHKDDPVALRVGSDINRLFKFVNTI